MKKSGSLKCFIFGVSSIIIAVLSMIWTPLDLMMEERLRMRPGLFTYNWWYNLPDIVKLKVYIFNITNAESFLNGTDERLRLEEVGPIIFKEMWTHSDVVFNDNGTMTYTVRKHPVYDPSLNTIDLNATMVYPNLPVLLSVSSLWDTNVFVKFTLNRIFETLKSKPIVKKTLYEILYNNTDPYLDLGHSILPSIAAPKNVGILPNMYDGAGDRVTMFIGSKHGHQRFSLIDNINGSTYIPGRGSSCHDDIIDATEASIYTQFVPKNRIMKYFKRFVCRTIPLVYKKEVYKQGVKTYLFSVPEYAYNRTKPANEDCYRSTPTLPDGLIDMSPCWFNFPVIGSFPHFLYGDAQLQNYVDGLTPDPNKHLPRVFIEPITGISFSGEAMMQANIYVKPLTGFHEMFDRFNNSVIPMFYAIAGNDYLPDYMVNFVKLLTWLPTIGRILTVLLILFGFYCMWYFYNRNIGQGRIFSDKRNDKIKELDIVETKENSNNINLKKLFLIK